ncbi:MAG: hypothetical protein JJU10_10320 [Idiomarina sp.]|nr:hypothetical protein [Idiomarina sp.]
MNSSVLSMRPLEEARTRVQQPVLVVTQSPEQSLHFEDIQELGQAAVMPELVLVSCFRNYTPIHPLIQAGFRHFIDINEDTQTIAEKVSLTSKGGVVICPRVQQWLVDGLQTFARRKAKQMDMLTSREKQVISSLAKGHSNRTIARELGMAETTAKVHVKHILKKLDMTSRLEATAWFLRNN